MYFMPLFEEEITAKFFKNVVYAVWHTYDRDDRFEFLHIDGGCYKSGHPKKLDKVFPVVKNLDWSKRGWENWTWYYMGMGGGAVFVRNDILEPYKLYAEIDDKCIEYGTDFQAAEKALAETIEKGLITVSEKLKAARQRKEEFLRRRAERFTWQPGDLVFYSSREECEKAAAKEGRKVVWYD